MHLWETYALKTSSKIDKPFIIEHFYPLDTDKYITISNSSGMEAKNYPHYQDVVDFILPIVKKEGYTIFQIGNKDDKSLEGCVPLYGKTNLNQTAYILKNSQLHIGNDSFPIHLASSYNVPIVGLYSVSPIEVCGPYWGDKDKQKLLSPDFSLVGPTFNPSEKPSRVQEIKIEEVVSAVLQLLKIDCPDIETKYMGHRYTNQVIELIPNQVLKADFASHLVINIRADLLSEVNETIVLHNLQVRKSALSISQEFKNIEGLNRFKQHLLGFFYDVTDSLNLEFLKKLVLAGLPPQIIYRGEDIDYLNDLKFKLIDFKMPPIKHLSTNKDNIDKLIKVLDNSNENTYIKSNRVILSDQKVYLSLQHWREDKITTEKHQKLDIQNKENLLKEEEFYYIYNYVS